jgi:ATP-dependent DNA ligase
VSAIDFTYRARRPIELCQLVGRWDRRTIPIGGMTADEKIDGWRGLHFRGLDGQPKLWTRGGHEINGAGHILLVIAEMERIEGQRLFVDGEFQVDGTLLATKTWCESGWKAGGEAGIFHAFDIMPENNWQAGRCNMPLIERRAWLKALIGEAMATLSGEWAWREGSKGKPLNTPIRGIEAVHLATVADIWAEAERVWAMGGEGCVIKKPEAPYVRGRSDAWLKVKKLGVR